MKYKLLFLLFIISSSFSTYANIKEKRSGPLSSVKTLIFDFDGTICDSYQAALEILNNSTKEFGHRKIHQHEIPDARDKPLSVLFQYLGLTQEKVPAIVERLRTDLGNQIDTLKAFNGIESALLELKRSGYKLGIITSNSETNVLRFNKKNNLNVFDFVQSVSLLGKDVVIRDILLKHKLSHSEAVYVGDETRDIQASKKAGISVIAVSWGFNSKKALQSENPDYIIDMPAELPQLFLKE